MLHRCLLTLALAAVAARPVGAQSSDTTPYFDLEVQQLTRTYVPALHSGAWAQHDGRWLFVAGRTDGLHPLFVGTEAFPAASAQGAFVVYDPVADEQWTATLDVLPDSVADPLRVTNPQFYQHGQTLYVVGGYGVDSMTGEKTTFGSLTAIDVPRMIDAVRTGTPIAEHIRRLDAARLAVTGGHLAHLPGTDADYVLAGGHFFAGEYLTPSQEQAYTDALRFFTIEDDGVSLALSGAAEVKNEQFHRRDGNLGPTVAPATEAEGLALYGGVFTPDPERLPYRRPILIDGTTATVLPFEARFGHYTAPLVPLFDREAHAMHTVFLGGMGQFFVSESDVSNPPTVECEPEGTRGFVCSDTFVPFISAVAALSMAEDGTLAEHVLAERMPGLFGTNAAYFPNPDVPTYANGVIDLRALLGRTLVGHVAGGIETSAPHPGLMSGPSWATGILLAVYVTPLTVPGVAHEQPEGFRVESAAPNPFRTTARLAVTLDAPGPLTVEVFDLLGRRVATLHDGPLAAGPHTFTVDGADWPSGVYVARITGARGTATRRLVRLR